MTDRELIARSRWTGEADRDHVYHHSDLSDAERRTRFGTAAVDMPASFEAGSSIDTRFRFVLGETELPKAAGLRIAWRWPFDWAALQSDDDGQPNYLTLKTPPTCEVEPTFERAGGLNPWQHHIDLRVTHGKLRSGDVVEVILRAWEGPTFSTEDGYFLMLISPAGNERWTRLVDPPRFRIEPGPAHHLIAIAPADGSVGETATVRVRAVDEWGNATSVEAPRLTGAVRIGTPVENDGYAVWEVPVSWTQAGVHRLEVQAGDLRTTTNPSRIHEQPQKQRLLWGDLHGGQSEIGCGAGSLDHHYAYARDVAGLQFTSQQANDHYITAALWQHVRDVTPRYNSPDFLAFLGCEWSPYTQDGGDRNVIYLTDEPALHRSDRFFEETDPDATADLRQAPEFLESFRTRDVLLNLHVGGRPTNLDFHAAEIEPLFEVHSTHATSEWFLFDAISRGYKVGVTAGTDGVMGRPGACGPGRRVTRNVRNGLTAVVAESLNQRHVADAFLERRCYGTSGARILLDVQVSGAPMGAEITSGGPIRICAQVEGTAPIERVDFFRGVECIHSQTLTTPDPNRLRLLWGGARERGTARAQRQSWDGTLQVSGARIDDVRPVGMQSPDDRIISHEQGFRFDAVTAGNDMGCTFTVDRTVDQTGDQTGDQTVETAARPTEDPTFHIVTDIASFEASLSQIQAETLTVAAGGLERRLELGPAPLADTSHTGTDASCSGQAEFEDTNPGAGEHAYWVRIIQTDRHRAWSSPVYVTVSGS